MDNENIDNLGIVDSENVDQSNNEIFSKLLSLEDGSSDEVLEIVENDADDVEPVEETIDEQPEMDSEVEDDAGENETDEVEPDAEETKPVIDDTYEVEINGEKIPLSELKNGYLRQSDYTEKTQVLAREVEQTKAERYAMSTKIVPEIDAIKRDLAYEFGFNQPDWEKLSLDDPYEFTVQRKAWDLREERLRQIHAFESNLKETMRAREEEVFYQNQEKAREDLLNANPELRDNDLAKSTFKAMAALMKEAGYSKDEIEGLGDFRTLNLLYELHRLREGAKKQTEAKKVLAETPKVNTPKSSASNKSNTTFDSAIKNLNGGDSSEARMNVFEQLLKLK